MKLPDRLGPFHGVEGLPLIIAASNAVVYLYDMVRPGLAAYLVLAPGALYAGEYWRLATFLFVPPPMSPLFLFFWLYLLYVYADALETSWGPFRFTLFYAAGALATMAAGLFPAPGAVPNAFLNASLFLAFATLFPDVELLLFFFIPVKVKYLGWATGIWMAWCLGTGDALTRLAVAAALGNYLLFMGPDLWEKGKLRWQVWGNRRRWG